MAELNIPIKSFWLHSHGAGGDADFDLVMERDAEGLPCLRGRHIKGLLRLAMDRAIAWKWGLSQDQADALLGEEGGHEGCLSISTARIAGPDRASLRADHTSIPLLFERLSSTAINDKGTAAHTSLRMMEGALPMALVCSISFDPPVPWWSDVKEDNAKKSWRCWIDCALPALDEIGAKRTRGFGRTALLAWKEVEA